MPIYRYRCLECGKEHDISHSRSESVETINCCKEQCGVVKIPAAFAVSTKENTVGKLTEDYIKQNQEVLEELKKHTRLKV